MTPTDTSTAGTTAAAEAPRTHEDRSADTPVVLSVEGLDISYRSRSGDLLAAVEGVSLQVRAARTTAVVGESGSGKSSTASAVIGLLARNAVTGSGRILLGDRDLATLTPGEWRAVRGARIGYIPQDPGNSLNPLKTIGASVAESLRIHRKADTQQARARVLELLDRVGIDRPELRADQYPHELSGGMRQRVLIAAAIALEPDLIIADEPTSALDVTVQKRILDLLDDLRAEGAGILFITHDLAVAAERADELVVMQGGKVVESGPAVQVFTQPESDYTRRLLADAPSLVDLTTHGTGSHGAGPRAATAAADGRPAEGARGQGASAADPAPTLLEVSGLTQVYGRAANGDVIGLEDVGFSVPEGTTHGIVGESGSGKSTLGKILTGFLDPQAGTARIGDFDAAALPRGGSLFGGAARRERKAFHKAVQLVHQNPYSALDPAHSIASTLTEPLRNFRLGTRTDRARAVREAMDRVALPARLLTRRPRELSGGQLQRVAIARALIIEPRLVVLDEAVSALDVTVQAQILRLLDDLQQELGLTYVFISHDLAVVRQIADTVSVLSKGRQVEAGPTARVYSDPQEDYTKRLLAAIPRPTTREK
ncbi:ABC transporter ATP-binding protein [Brevibacterium litoralis]|uniref:ABC transporter ATP-binding protein n=1 Tax=Brevibacterium litoralis TaxID=3138935 RepID=UPI0032EC9C64